MLKNKILFKSNKSGAVKKIIESNYQVIQFVNALSVKYSDTFLLDEKDSLMTIEKHMINLSDSLSKLIK